jgi:hypothetical protein
MPIDNNFCFSIYLETTNQNADSLHFNIIMSCSNILQQLRVRYLTIASELSSDIQVVEIIQNDTNGLVLSNSSQLIGSKIVSANASSTNTALILKGFKIGGQNSYISLKLRYWLTDLNVSIFAKSRD